MGSARESILMPFPAFPGASRVSVREWVRSRVRAAEKGVRQ